MSTNRLKAPNELLHLDTSYKELLNLIFVECAISDLNWSTNTLTGNKKLNSLFKECGFGESIDASSVKINAAGRTFLIKILVDFNQFPKSADNDRYEFEEIIGSGRESIVFKAKHKLLLREYAIKLIYNEEMGDSYLQLLKHVNSLESKAEATILLPFDAYPQIIRDIWGNTLTLRAIVFPYKNSKTLEAYISDARPLTPFVVREFISQVGVSLYELEKLGLAHGDLHSGNVLVEETKENEFIFQIIDISGATHNEVNNIISDFTMFVNLLVTIVATIPLKRMSLQRHLGAETYFLIKDIFDKKITDFKGLIEALDNGEPYSKYQQRRDLFLSAKFSDGDTLALVRHEEITNPGIARSLFLPFNKFFVEFSGFGRAILYGHRGSGKSSYLASLAYFPDVDSVNDICDPRAKFGILFACRQGEFKQLRSVAIDRAKKAYTFLKHLLITKIVRKTLEVLEKDQRRRIQPETFKNDITGLLNFLKKYLPCGVTGMFSRGVAHQLQSLRESVIRYEISYTDNLVGEVFSELKQQRLFTEEDLKQFFITIRQCFTAFRETKFFLLFDDAGVPNMPEHVQKVLNEILRATNEVYCVKISSEKFAYIEEDSDGKILEDSHDFSRLSLAEELVLSGGQKVERRELAKYFRDLVAKRLLGFASTDIEDYLGKDFCSPREFIRDLASSSPSKAKYAGWNIIWQLADRTPRHLLEVISTIFAKAGIDKKSTASIIKASVQDSAVRGYSAAKLQSIAYLPGTLSVNGYMRPLGQHLNQITTAFGRVARANIRKGRMGGSRERYNEMLAIEIDRAMMLDKETQKILRSLIQYAIFDDSRIAVTRDGHAVQQIYVLNRMYTPALQISYRREIHWRLTNTRFQDFLREPIKLAGTTANTLEKSRDSEPHGLQQKLDI